MNFTSPIPSNPALEILMRKKDWPTNLSTEDIRAMKGEIDRLSLYSARTTSLHYLTDIRKELDDLVSGKSNFATARANLKASLEKLGYNENTHFGTEADKAIPPAAKGSLTDLASDKRITLMLDMNERLLFNSGYMQAGLDPVRLSMFPAWELVRVYEREHERDDTPMSWAVRWKMAGGEFYSDRMIALKDDEVWDNLGDSALFPDGTDSNAPPYWWNSGGGIEEVSKAECREVGLLPPAGEPKQLDRSLLGKFFADPDRATLANLRATRADLLAAATKIAA